MPDAREMGIEELQHLGMILLGAACADGASQREESEAIIQILAEEQGGGELPEPVIKHLMAFDVQRFDLATSCLALDMSTPERRRWLLQLCARVTECDDVHDLDESDYIVRVAKCIGAGREEYAGLTVDELSDDEVSDDGPPPVPAAH